MEAEVVRESEGQATVLGNLPHLDGFDSVTWDQLRGECASSARGDPPICVTAEQTPCGPFYEPGKLDPPISGRLGVPSELEQVVVDVGQSHVDAGQNPIPDDHKEEKDGQKVEAVPKTAERNLTGPKPKLCGRMCASDMLKPSEPYAPAQAGETKDNRSMSKCIACQRPFFRPMRQGDNMQRCEGCDMLGHVCLYGPIVLPSGFTGNCIRCGLKGPDAQRSKADNCPSCGHSLSESGTCVYEADGGSTVCKRCMTNFHVCRGGLYRIGSPGPTKCRYCATRKGDTFQDQLERGGVFAHEPTSKMAIGGLPNPAGTREEQLIRDAKRRLEAAGSGAEHPSHTAETCTWDDRMLRRVGMDFACTKLCACLPDLAEIADRCPMCSGPTEPMSTVWAKGNGQWQGRGSIGIWSGLTARKCPSCWLVIASSKGSHIALI
jgi:hypothetical protein